MRYFWFALIPGFLWMMSGGDADRAAPPEKVTSLRFVDLAHSAGIDKFHDVSGGPTKNYILESKGGGVAVFDYNGDGWLDIFLVSGATFEEMENPHAPHPHRSKLFRNNGDGTFTDVTEAAGLGAWGWGMGAAAADYDNDGCTDLYVTYYGKNVLYHNNCDGTFADVTQKAGVAAGSWSTGAAWGDYDRDGHLDLYVARYINFQRAEVPGKGQSVVCQYKGVPVQCGPRGLKTQTAILYHNNGDGTFTDVTNKALGPDVAAYYGFTPLWVDVDNDGWPDLYVADDGTPNLLYRNRHDGTFEEVGAAAGCAYDRDGLEQSSMGADFGDYNHDGWLDIFVTNFSDDHSTLYKNVDGGNFNDITEQAKLLSVGWNNVKWGTKFFDYDLDGWPDLFLANGHVYVEADRWGMDTGYKQHPQVLRNQQDGTFQDVTAELGEDLLQKHLGRGLALGSLFNDGSIDIVVNNLDDTPSLYHCPAPVNGQWILFKLQGTRSNRDGLGARIKLRAGGMEQVQEVHQSGGFLASNDVRARFGLGSSTVVDELEIDWPSGLVQHFHGIRSQQILRIKEGESEVAHERMRRAGANHLTTI
jgi:hypothetical protein